MKGEYTCLADIFANIDIHVRSCQEQLAEMVHTRDGSRAVREFIARGTAKVPFIHQTHGA